MTYRDVVGQIAGAKPSAAVGRFLDDHLLPDEPVLAAVRGAVRHEPAWVVVTPGVTVVVRDGAPVTVEGEATPSEGMGWTVEGRRADTVLHVHLDGGQVTVDAVAARRAQAFVVAADGVVASLDGGYPPQVAGVLRDLDPAGPDHAGTARHARTEASPRLTGCDLYLAIAGALSDPAELSYHLALVLVASAAVTGDVPRPGRRETVTAVFDRHHTAVEDYAAVRSLRAAQRRRVDTAAWRDVVADLAGAVAAAAALLGPGSARARASLHATAASLRDVSDAPDHVTATAPAAVSGGLLDTLERLQQLREAGALTETEYDDLKAQALAG